MGKIFDQDIHVKYDPTGADKIVEHVIRDIQSGLVPFNDEVVTFDGKLTADVVAELQSQIPGNVPSTDKAIAELRLTKRAASRGYRVPQGPVILGIKAQGSEEVSEFQLIWEYTPEKIQDRG